MKLKYPEQKPYKCINVCKYRKSMAVIKSESVYRDNGPNGEILEIKCN